MNIEFKSTELGRYLEKILDKDIENITSEDLKEIEELKFSKINFMRKETDYSLEDLVFFHNLEKIILFKFVIMPNDIEILNKLANLKYLHFDFCDFQNNNLELNNNISRICFSMCKNLKLNLLSLKEVESFEIIGNDESKEEIDINEISNMPNLEELCINNFIIKNTNEISIKFPNLKILNIDGSVIDISNTLPMKENINVSHKEKFILN